MSKAKRHDPLAKFMRSVERVFGGDVQLKSIGLESDNWVIDMKRKEDWS